MPPGPVPPTAACILPSSRRSHVCLSLGGALLHLGRPFPPRHQHPILPGALFASVARSFGFLGPRVRLSKDASPFGKRALPCPLQARRPGAARRVPGLGHGLALGVSACRLSRHLRSFLASVPLRFPDSHPRPLSPLQSPLCRRWATRSSAPGLPSLPTSRGRAGGRGIWGADIRAPQTHPGGGSAAVGLARAVWVPALPRALGHTA